MAAHLQQEGVHRVHRRVELGQFVVASHDGGVGLAEQHEHDQPEGEREDGEGRPHRGETCFQAQQIVHVRADGHQREDENGGSHQQHPAQPAHASVRRCRQP